MESTGGLQDVFNLTIFPPEYFPRQDVFLPKLSVFVHLTDRKSLEAKGPLSFQSDHLPAGPGDESPQPRELVLSMQIEYANTTVCYSGTRPL